MKRHVYAKLRLSFGGAAIVLSNLLMILSITQGCRDAQHNKIDLSNIDLQMLPKQLTILLPDLSSTSVPLRFVLIDSGAFTMGSPLDENGRSENDWPPHNVTISRPFYLAQFELTQAQWECLMDKNPSYFKNQPNHPVEKVTWHKCQKFIHKLNNLGLGNFRLPTEAEWEYACRAGTSTRFYFGDAPECSGDLTCQEADAYMWWAGNNDPQGAKDVGLKEPNAWGLYDMHGNVHEWCSDNWQAPYECGPQIDPQGPNHHSRFMLIFVNRTARGGCFQHGGLNNCRSAYRFFEQSTDYYKGLGFRLVRDIDGREGNLK